MDTIDLRAMVKRVVGGEVAEFTRRHPHLAAALDERLIVERTLDELDGSEEFSGAMQKVEAGIAGPDLLEKIITRVAKLAWAAL